jgi:hypothetical protein
MADPLSHTTEEPTNFLDIAREIERRAGAWCFMAAEGPDGEGEEWTCGSTLPDRAAEAIRHQAKYLELAQQVIDEERMGQVAAVAAMKMGDETIERYEAALRIIASWGMNGDTADAAVTVARKALGDE